MKIPPSRLEAHRGASGAYPENTMLAFAKAREAGALSIETDLSLLADGGFAVFHDSALGRTVAGDASLDSLTSAEIGTMDAGAWRGREFAGETVPLCEDLFHWQEVAARLGLEALHLDKDIVTPRMVEAIHSAGLRVRVWTVNEPAEMKRMIDAGVDTVITDVPEAFL